MKLMSEMRPEQRYLHALFLPLERVIDAPSWQKAFGLLAILFEILLGTPLFTALLLLIAFSLMDYLLGSKLADLDGKWDEHRARAGLIGKASNVALVLMVWLAEVVLWGVADRYGLDLPESAIGTLATALAGMLIIGELDSFDRKREALTGSPTPIIRPILNALRSIIERLVPVSKGKP